MKYSSFIASSAITRSPEENKKYETDPLVHPYCTPNTALDIIANADYLTKTGWKDLKVPILLTHGTADTLTWYEAIQIKFNTNSIQAPSLRRSFTKRQPSQTRLTKSTLIGITNVSVVHSHSA